MPLMPIEAAEDLVGAVKKVESRTVSVTVSNGEKTEQPESESVCFFDEWKNPVEISHSYSGKPSYKTVNRFDSNNRLIEQLEYTDEELKYKREFSYNDRGRLAEMKFFDHEADLISTDRPVYTSEGLRIEEIFQEPYFFEGKRVNGQMNFTVLPELSAAFSINNFYLARKVSTPEDRLLEVSFYNRLRIVRGKIFVQYDSDGNPSEVVTYGNDTTFSSGNSGRFEKLLFPLLWIHNLASKLYTAYRLCAGKDFGKASKCLLYGAPVDEILIQFDANQKVNEIDYRSTFLGGGKTVFRYDEKGNKTEEIHYSADGLFDFSKKHDYQYDSQENWISRKSFYRYTFRVSPHLMEHAAVTRRTISYY